MPESIGMLTSKMHTDQPALIRIRSYQLRRQIAGLGLVYRVVVVLALGVAVYFMYLQYQSFVRGCAFSAGIVMITLFIHTRRNDGQFILHAIDHPRINLFAEYFLFALLLTIPALFTKNWFFVPAIALGQFLISQLRIVTVQRTFLPNLSRLVPPACFEWISGIRTNKITFGIVLALGLALSWVKFFPLIFLLVFTGIVASFYQESEPVSMLIAQRNKSVATFLRDKITRHSALLVVCFLPIALINGVLHPELIWLTAVFQIVQLNVLWFAILLKYSRYKPGERLSSNSLPVSLASLSTIFLPLFPIVPVMGARYYKLSAENLRAYIHD